MKISIIGASNSGKSSLARKINQKFSVPYLQIDRLWFDNGGNDLFQSKTPTDEARAVVSEKIIAGIELFLSSNKHWVCDGTYKTAQPIIAEQADIIILIKRPLLYRMWSNVIRVFSDKHRHPEVTKFQDLKFTTHLVKRHRNNEQKNIEVLIEPFLEKVIILSSFKEIDAYFDSL